MSGQMTFNTYEEVIEYVKNHNSPICFQVNYLPDEDKYDLWIGNQPYYSYEKWIEDLEEEKNFLRENLVKTKANENMLTKQNKRYRELIEKAKEYADSPKILTDPAGILKILSLEESE